MASIRKEIRIEAAPEDVWAAVRDVGAVHERLCPGVLTDARMDGEGARVVTFANGLVVREVIVSLDDAARRFAYSAQGGSLQHHHASIEVLAERGATRLLWTIDVLPHAMAAPIAGLMEGGAAAMRSALEKPVAA
jgi:carbon monoxide dehydrogenase subunit G